MTARAKKSKGCLTFRNVMIGMVIVSTLIYVFFLRGAIDQMRESGKMQDARALGLALFTYSNNNNGKYPDGKSSTEIFQKLLDGGYLVDEEDQTGTKQDLGIVTDFISANFFELGPNIYHQLTPDGELPP